jgi:hypothetical protein
LDVSGRGRPDTGKTVGCGEYFPGDIVAPWTRALDAAAAAAAGDDDSEKAINRPLSDADVGPSYLQPGAPTSAPVAAPAAAPTAPPAGAPPPQQQVPPPTSSPSPDPYNATGTSTAAAPGKRARKPADGSDAAGAMLDANVVSQMVIGVVVFAALAGVATAAYAWYRKRQEPPETFQPLADMAEESDHHAAAAAAAGRKKGSGVDVEDEKIDENDAGVEMMMAFGRQTPAAAPAPAPAREGGVADGPARSPLHTKSNDSADADADADAASDKSTSQLIRPLPAPNTATPRPVAIRLPPPPPSPAAPPPLESPPTA